MEPSFDPNSTQGRHGDVCVYWVVTAANIACNEGRKPNRVSLGAVLIMFQMQQVLSGSAQVGGGGDISSGKFTLLQLAEKSRLRTRSRTDGNVLICLCTVAVCIFKRKRKKAH